MNKQAIYYPEKEKIKIVFPFDKKLISEIKKIPGRKYHSGKTKYWSAPASVEAIDRLEKLSFDIDPKLFELRREKRIKVEDMTADIDIPGLGGSLFEFQAKGVSFIEARKGRALIGDEMGLGKTVQALAWLQLNPEIRPAIIVCPASLKLNWRKEAHDWMDNPKTQVLNGTTPYKITGDIIIINYSILKDWVEAFAEIDAQAIIMDEIHYIKNSSSKRSKAAKKIAKPIKHVIGLTGTAIINRPAEIVNAVQIIDKSVIPSRWQFLHRYCDPKHNGFGWDFSGASNVEELHEKLTTTLMIRRKKKNVLKDLPDKIRSFVPIELENKATYDKAEDDFTEFVKEEVENEAKEEIKKMSGRFDSIVSIDEEKLEELKEQKASSVTILSKIEALKQIAVEGKLNQAIKWIQDYIESGEKLVIMCVHKFVIKALMDKFKGIAVKVDGSVTGTDRQKAVQRFQKEERIKLFIGNIQAAGVGLTLTAAKAVAFLELPWTPGEIAQAEDRVHRIGQKESVTIYYLLAEGTIEEEIAQLISEKRKILDAVLDGEETDNSSLISELIKKYKKLV